MAATVKRARVLVAIVIGLIHLKPDDVIEGDPKTIAQHEKGGSVDSNKEAVAYAMTVNGGKVTPLDNEESDADQNQNNGAGSGVDPNSGGSGGDPQA